MPFRSEKQRRYLWANEPEVAKKWAKEEKKNKHGEGGIVDKKKRRKYEEPSVWDKLKQGFEPSVERVKDEERKKWAKKKDEPFQYEEGGIVEDKKKKKRDIMKEDTLGRIGDELEQENEKMAEKIRRKALEKLRKRK